MSGLPHTIESIPSTMKAMVQMGYGAARDVLRTTFDQPVPQPRAGEILVRNRATSVNPVDSAVREGYGSAYFEAKGMVKLPFIPGRDVAGVVVEIGPGVSTFAVGDDVWAGTLSGGSAEYVAVPAEWAARLPTTLSPLPAASMPYVALTAWTALVKHARLTPENTSGKKIIVPRGAGGVGSFAIQLLKAWGAHVATICSASNIDLVRSLGADIVLDRATQSVSDVLSDYDVAFDTSFDMEEKLLKALKIGADAVYVSVVNPKLRLIDKHGLDQGEALGNDLLSDRVAAQRLLGRRYFWSFMEPDGQALSEIGRLVDSGLIKPIIDRVYKLDQLDEAQDYCATKQARGKILIDIGVAKSAESRTSQTIGIGGLVSAKGKVVGCET